MNKVIEVDWDNPSDLKKHITILQKRRKKILRDLGYDQIYFNGSKHNLKTIFPLFEKMYESDFSFLYETSSTDNIYYVYAHCNPLKPLNVKHNIKHLFLASKFPKLKYEPFYIGKGKGNRYLDTNRNDSYRKIKTNIQKYKKDVDIIILKENLTESVSLNLESILIDILGLKCLSDHGFLCNLDEGLDHERRRMLYEDEDIIRILKRNGFKINTKTRLRTGSCKMTVTPDMN